MTSDKRNFVDFETFPGKTVGSTYTFYPLYHKDSTGKIRVLRLYVRLVDIKHTNDEYTIDWEPNDTEYPILPSYFNMGTKIPDNIISQYWKESGVVNGKITRHEPSFMKKANVGRANERNVLQQAMIAGRKDWLKKKERGSTTDASGEESTSSTSVRYYPMLLHKFSEKENKLDYPRVIVQPKHDGIRGIVYLNIMNKSIDEANTNDVEIYTRQMKSVDGFNLHKAELLPILVKFYDNKTNTSIYIDGEFYKHNVPLQLLSGIFRNPAKNNIASSTVYMYIFDAFYPNKPNEVFRERFARIRKIFSGKRKYKCLRLSETKIARSKDELMSLYKKFTTAGYEGLIAKNANSKYLFDSKRTSDHLRSDEVLKLKPKFTSEFKLIDYKEGTRGRDKGAILYICETSSGVKFNVTPKDITNDGRKKLYKKYMDDPSAFDRIRNKMITLEYEDISKNGVPLRAKAIAVRDYE